jgi:GNAT superfamily N-acetyltransferase
MDRQAIDTFVSQADPVEETTKAWKGDFNRALVETAVNGCLSNNGSNNFRLRLAAEGDLETITQLVQGLADYVKEPDGVHLGASDYILDGFQEDPLFYCFLLDCIAEDGKTHTCGYAFCFFGYALGEGRFLYLEDLFIKEEYRKNGGGMLVMLSLARICKALQCSGLYWQALDWNTGGLTFYKKIGAEIHDGVQTSRYAGEALKGPSRLERILRGTGCRCREAQESSFEPFH